MFGLFGDFPYGITGECVSFFGSSLFFRCSHRDPNQGPLKVCEPSKNSGSMLIYLFLIFIRMCYTMLCSFSYSCLFILFLGSLRNFLKKTERAGGLI